MRRVFVFVGAALALVACQPASTAAGTEGEGPTVGPAAAQAGQTAEAYVRALYTTGEMPEGLNGEFSDRTRALIEETERLTQQGDVGFFDADPICDCQDGTPVLETVASVSTGADTADVSVVQSFAEPGNFTHRKTFRLVREEGRWKIDDMTYQDMGEFEQEPLVQRLNAWIADMTTNSTPTSGA